MSRDGLAAEFIGESAGRIFVLAHYPRSSAARCVLICPPFAEEMNKARKMVTELSRRLLARGLGVIVPDLFGTGDSEGNFADADWERWLEDLKTAERWALARGWQVESLLGIRLGCLLAANHAHERESAVSRTAFWQPVLDGSRALDQFLRLRTAASLMRDDKETVAGLKAQLAGGRVVDVAGYGVSSRLAAQMESLRLSSLYSDKLGDVHWFEVLRAADAPVSAATTKSVDELKQRGAAVSLHTVVGEPFWASTEIVCLPQLLTDTAGVLCDGRNA